MRRVSFAVAAAMLVSGCSNGPESLIDQASNSASQTICSATFVSGLAPDDAYRAELRPEPGMWAVAWALNYDVDRAQREIDRVRGGEKHTDEETGAKSIHSSGSKDRRD